MIDGVDGMVFMVGIIVSFVFVIMFVVLGWFLEVVIVVVMVGLIGVFLIYNFLFVFVFFGDVGSMMIGFLIGVVVVNILLKEVILLVMVVLVVVIVILLFDFFVVIFCCCFIGCSIYIVDWGYIYYVLMVSGLGLC